MVPNTMMYRKLRRYFAVVVFLRIFFSFFISVAKGELFNAIIAQPLTA